MNDPALDVIVVGPGPQGLTPALALGRMRRRGLLLDTDAPANAVSAGVHNLLGHDGRPPADLRALGREQLRPYDSVEVRADGASAARRDASGGFEVDLAGGETHTARRLLLAHGMDYVLPAVPGVAALWGDRVFHCPYCHGWEVRDRRVAVLATGPKAVHQALLLQSLTDDCVLVVGPDYELGPDQLRALGEVAAFIERGDVREISGSGEGLVVRFADGRELEREPTACELETLAQTWSEHCKHKTFTGAIDFDGRRIENLLKETIVRATRATRARPRPLNGSRSTAR